MKSTLPFLFLALIIISCNPVGETISGETPLDPQLISTVENLDLKAGDQLVIWGKMDASFLKNDNVPVYDLSYHLSLDGKTIENSTARMFVNEKNIINSSYEIQKEEEEEENESSDSEPTESNDDSAENPDENIEKIKKSDWIFEQEIIKIPIKKDGKYTLDYKATSSAEAAQSIFTKVAVIIRKQ